LPVDSIQTSVHLCFDNHSERSRSPLEKDEKRFCLAAGCIDEFIIDCKDTNPEIYRSYTGKDNAQMLENLEKLVRLIGTERIIVRLPLIPEFNTEDDRMKSQQLLEAIGITRFDRFTYLTPEQQALRK